MTVESPVETIKYSVIIPIYNAEKTIAKCMRSVLIQKREDVELILIDNSSTDRTHEVITAVSLEANWCSKIIYHKEKNRGVSVTRNSGIQCASGKYLLFLDSDDQLADHSFDKLDNFGECDCILFHMEGIPDMTDFLEQIGNEYHYEDALAKLLRVGLLHSVCNKCFSREKLLRKNLMFDETLSIGEDFLFSMQYCLACNEIKLCKESLYIIGNENMYSLSRGYRPNLTKQLVRLYKLQEEVLQGCTLSDEVKAELLREMDYWHSKAVCSCIAETFKVSFKPYILQRKKYQKIGRKFDTPLRGFDGYCSKVHQILNWLLRNHLIYPIYVVTALKKARAYKIYREMK